MVERDPHVQRCPAHHDRAVASGRRAALRQELVSGGYTHVCEFHYLHHKPDGTPYANPLTLSWALADAATEAGIGVTLLPVLYERASFAQSELRDNQRRFATDADAVLAMHERHCAPAADLGCALALPSIRCVPAAPIR